MPIDVVLYVCLPFDALHRRTTIDSPPIYVALQIVSMACDFLLSRSSFFILEFSQLNWWSFLFSSCDGLLMQYGTDGLVGSSDDLLCTGTSELFNCNTQLMVFFFLLVILGILVSLNYMVASFPPSDKAEKNRLNSSYMQCKLPTLHTHTRTGLADVLLCCFEGWSLNAFLLIYN